MDDCRRASIENAFSYHKPRPGDEELYKDIRAKAKELAILVETHVPDSREKSLARTNLEQAVMWANAGIARS